jgi:hypothetical protein
LEILQNLDFKKSAITKNNPQHQSQVESIASRPADMFGDRCNEWAGAGKTSIHNGGAGLSAHKNPVFNQI